MWLLTIWVLASWGMGYLGRDRLIGFWGFFFLALIFSPMICLILLLLTAPAPRSRPAP